MHKFETQIEQTPEQTAQPEIIELQQEAHPTINTVASFIGRTVKKGLVSYIDKTLMSP